MTLAASLVRLHRCQHLLLQRFQLRNRHNLGKSNGFRGDLTSPRTFSWSWPVSIAARFSIEFRLSTKAVLICIPRFPSRRHQNLSPPSCGKQHPSGSQLRNRPPRTPTVPGADRQIFPGSPIAFVRAHIRLVARRLPIDRNSSTR